MVDFADGFLKVFHYLLGVARCRNWVLNISTATQRAALFALSFAS